MYKANLGRVILLQRPLQILGKSKIPCIMYKANLSRVIPGGERSGVDTWPVRSILTSCYWKKRHLRIYSTIRSGFPSFRVIIIICYY